MDLPKIVESRKWLDPCDRFIFHEVTVLTDLHCIVYTENTKGQGGCTSADVTVVIVDDLILSECMPQGFYVTRVSI